MAIVFTPYLLREEEFSEGGRRERVEGRKGSESAFFSEAPPLSLRVQSTQCAQAA